MCLFPGQGSETEFIGFTAWKTRQQTVDDLGQLVTFEKDSINVGMFYNPTNSSFTCPKDAAYLVSVAIRTLGYGELYLELEKESDVIFSLWNDGASNPNYTISHSVIIPCQTGEVLTVRGYTHDTPMIKGDFNIPHTTFTAFMITGQ